MTDNAEPLKGVRGWLLLFVFALVVAPIRIGHFLATTHWPIFTTGIWHELTTPGTAAYHPLWGPLLVFEVIGNLGIIVLAIVTLAYLFRESRFTPVLAIVFMSWGAGFGLIDFFVADFIPAVAAQNDPQSAKELARSIGGAAIWIPYFLVSKRVKATFVN